MLYSMLVSQSCIIVTIGDNVDNVDFSYILKKLETINRSLYSCNYVTDIITVINNNCGIHWK